MAPLRSDKAVYNLFPAGRDLRPDGAHRKAKEIVFREDLLLAGCLFSHHQLAAGVARKPSIDQRAPVARYGKMSYGLNHARGCRARRQAARVESDVVDARPALGLREDHVPARTHRRP